MSRVEDKIDEYLASVAAVVREVDAKAVRDVVDVFDRAYRDRGTIFLFGNGGGAATSAHLACDLAKGTAAVGRRRIKALSLSTNVAVITAWANDTDYTNTFGEQLYNLADERDVAVAFSGSGMSPNVINALKVIKELGGTGVLFSGGDGGKAREHADIAVLVPSRNEQIVEDVHMVLGHVIFTLLRDRMGGAKVDGKGNTL
ncbi:MAG TPA: SIS domain-containing protein [bacterium]|nr:SIS domain-containing protein [bacterium]